ncbi:retrovirus-related Pol polyprotein from transposon 412 [Trichonephila clavipes]|uniref:Retrovirus-related Pol polyprotein from transposon 412 n=1 Tax=Trichonephila clavipes TaxID=2585209 RepID=A0A8X7BHK9_TRICX|nr:retrovirus-related Pol polyprotein from transposon 412 [Trichonephila clavipes]
MINHWVSQVIVFDCQYLPRIHLRSRIRKSTFLLARHRALSSYDEALLDSLELYLKNDVLYGKWESDDRKAFKWQLIPPQTRVSTVLNELHGSSTGGHFGVMKTLQKVRLLLRSSDGNNDILVVMDHFTKWPEAQPFIRPRGPDCCRGCSTTLDLKIRSSSTTVSAVHETTGYSPSQMLFRRDLRLPANLLFSRPPDGPLAPEEYVEKLQAWMEGMHHLAWDRIGLASEKMKTQYDAKATGHGFHGSDKM